MGDTARWFGEPSGRVRTTVGIAICTAAVFSAGCQSTRPSSDDPPLPVVDQIDDALAALDQRYSDPPMLFEVSANLVDVRVVVAEDWNDGVGVATSFAFRDDKLSEPTTLGEGQGSAFTADSVNIDESGLFDKVSDELPGALVTDFAVTAGPDQAPIYDATLRSESGGQLRVRLSGDGDVLEVMAE